MARNVRNAVFETNSSSSHSVTVTNEEIVDSGLSKLTLRKGVIEVRPHGYGWEWKRYYTPEGKIAYLLAQICAEYLSAAPGGKDCSADLKRQFEKARFLIEAVEKVTGCRVEVYPPAEKGWGSSVYVDGDSAGVGYELFGSKKSLAHFVLSKSSFVQTGNDNGAGPEFIPTDRGTSEELHPYNYAADCEHDGRFTLWTDAMTKNIRFESNGERLEANTDWRYAGMVEEALSDAVVVEAKVYVNGMGRSRTQSGRDMLHGYLKGFNKEREGAFRVLRDAKVETFEVGGGRDEPYLYGTRFELRCRAPADVVQELKKAIASIPKEAPGEGGPKP